MIIAVDGPAASGKGTLARKLSKHFDLAYLDTGSLYRAVALSVLRAGADPSDDAAALEAAQRLDPSKIDETAIRTAEIGEAASIVAAMVPVREAIRDLQREFARKPPDHKKGAVLDGRDIGTVICPDADIKLFVEASLEERARRRFLELTGAPSDQAATLTQDDVLADLRARDARDRNRTASPLKPAPDAHLLDTTNLSIEAAFEAACDIVDLAPR